MDQDYWVCKGMQFQFPLQLIFIIFWHGFFYYWSTWPLLHVLFLVSRTEGASVLGFGHLLSLWPIQTIPNNSSLFPAYKHLVSVTKPPWVNLGEQLSFHSDAYEISNPRHGQAHKALLCNCHHQSTKWYLQHKSPKIWKHPKNYWTFFSIFYYS